MKGIVVAVIVLTFIVLIAYAIFIYEMYRQKKFIFAPYVKPTPPKPYFKPLGEITTLTPDQQAERTRIFLLSARLYPL